jgi:hypothetical protein
MRKFPDLAQYHYIKADQIFVARLAVLTADWAQA